MENWKAQVRKGILEYCLFELLASRKKSYGYELIGDLEGLLSMDITESAVYSILNRSAKKGAVSVRKEKSPSGPPRRWYRLTTAGEERLKKMRSFMKSLDQSLVLLWNSREEDKQKS